jgi:uncharacterized protein (DUF1684 family)
VQVLLTRGSVGALPYCLIAPLPHFAIVSLCMALSACTSGPGPVDTRPYAQQIETSRQDKDAQFRSTKPGVDSPIPDAQRASFPGLIYFPIDPAYRVPASLALQSSRDPQVFVVQTSGREKQRRMPKVGSLSFSMQGVEYKLVAFTDEGSLSRLFVPFGDLTNGTDTYGGGRYLEIDRTASGVYDLDFNRAFNPYCVYNSTYDCPIPPRENRLAVAIRAGEKLPAGH